MLSINYKSENLSTLNIEYARLIEGDEDILEWKTFDETGIVMNIPSEI